MIPLTTRLFSHWTIPLKWKGSQWSIPYLVQECVLWDHLPLFLIVSGRRGKGGGMMCNESNEISN
jgi:hypothetical protein